MLHKLSDSLTSFAGSLVSFRADGKKYLAWKKKMFLKNARCVLENVKRF